MSLLKFIIYTLIAWLVIRFLMRIISPPKMNRPSKPPAQEPHPDSLDKPKFTIEAESVDYEIIEEPKDEK